MTLPLSRDFVLSRYETLRAEAETRLLTLEQMSANLARQLRA